MNRAERRRANRMERNGPIRLEDMPNMVQQHQKNMAQIIVTSALVVLAEDFNFSEEQLEQFNEKVQKKAMGMTMSMTKP